ncbi:MAG: GNAT family N-acetyltransferase [Phycisphaerae bacterium]
MDARVKRELREDTAMRNLIKRSRPEWPTGPSLRNWEKPPPHRVRDMKRNVAVQMGWGRLIFGHTFEDAGALAEALCKELPGQRDIAFYLPDPHVALAKASHELFLDPSHTYRLWLHQYRTGDPPPQNFVMRPVRTREDVEGINKIYAANRMVGTDPDFVLKSINSRILKYVVAEDPASGEILGTVMGVDHLTAFRDPENGASLWCLAVHPQAHFPGVGEALVRRIIERYQARGRAYLDLSVMHDNERAIALYEKLGFQRVPVFCLKHRNAINQPLFLPPPPEEKLNPYATIIVDEARQRGIAVEVLDAGAGFFRLTLGGRSIVCRESLSELTSAVAMSRCDDKRVTLRVLKSAKLRVPEQRGAGNREENNAFLQEHGRLVVKPARGEQGAGISVDVRSPEDLERAIQAARRVCDTVVMEEFVEGQDLRIIVINYELVAAAVRRPAHVVGTGQHTVAELIEKQSRRRTAATGGESHIPMDDETRRCVQSAGYELDSVLPSGEVLQVRKTANLHTGGTIHDVTADLHPALADAAVEGARALSIPVVGFDLLVPDVSGPDYTMIEANERPGLANHEPQPTAERFIDLLFPETRRAAGMRTAADRNGISA